MSTLTDLQEAVTNATATPELWQTAIAEYDALSARPTTEAYDALTAERDARPTPEAHQTAQDDRDAARAQFTALQDTHTVALAQTDQHKAAHAEALTKLKSAYALQHAVPEELLSGHNVAELEASLTGAKSIVEKIAAGIRTATAAQVPNGSPARSGPNLDAMSPMEKIRFGLSQSNGV